MKKRFLVRDWIIAIYFIISVVTIYQIAAKRHFNSSGITPEILNDIITQNKNIVFIDLRESNEMGRFPPLPTLLPLFPKFHIPFLWLREHKTLPTLTPGQITIFLCSDGNRSRLITTLLAEKGVHAFYLNEGLWSLKQLR